MDKSTRSHRRSRRRRRLARARRTGMAPVTWVRTSSDDGVFDSPVIGAPRQEFAPRPERKRRVAAELILVDLTALVLALLCATAFEAVAHGDTHWIAATIEGAWLSLVTVAILMVSLARDHFYDIDRLGWGSGEFTRLPQALAVGVIALVIGTFSIEFSVLSRRWVALTWLLSVLFVATSRMAWRIWNERYRAGACWLSRPTLVVGSNSEAAATARILSSDPLSHIVPVGHVSSSVSDQLSLDFCSPDVPRLGEARDLVKIVREHDIDTVLIVASAFDADVLQRMTRELRDEPVLVQVTSGLTEVLTSRVFVRAVSGVPVISLRGVSFSAANLTVKRVFDLVIGGLVILAGTPLWLIVVSLIKLTSPGPVLYSQERVGKAGKTFKMYKFRSMVVDADARLAALQAENDADGPLFKMEDDPRVTAVGKWMRKFSIDEMPQLINVMKGELSLVGPRPPLTHETYGYSMRDWKRLEVTPGMTGLWQVSGRSDLSFQEMVRLDVFYIENWSVLLDVSLLMRTVPAVLFARGAY